MISTKLKLTSGETVTGYYIDEKTKKEIENLIDISSRFALGTQVDSVRENLEELSSEIRRDFYYPIIQKNIVELLRNQDLTAQDIRKKVMPDSKKQYQARRSFWEVWEEWTRVGVLVRIPQAKHKPGLWHLSIRPTEVIALENTSTEPEAKQ